MAAGSIVIDLLMKTGQFETDTKRAEKRLREFEKAAERVGKAVAAGFTAAAAALAATVVSVSRQAAEIQKLSTIANTSATEFQKWAVASSFVGIEQEKLGDILKDVNDKVGEFLNTGGGPLKDFFEQVAPLIGVTAEQFRNLSGPQALQLYVDSLEKANLSQQDMTFYMEALASDATALLPILRDNGAEIQRLGDRAAETGQIMSDGLIAAAQVFREEMSLLQGSMRGAGNIIAETLLPPLNELLRGMNEFGGQGSAVQAVANGIAVVFETIAVLGVNIAYVFNETGRELGAMAAQLAALATLDFDAFQFIREERLRDAEEARRKIDELTASILNARAASEGMMGPPISLMNAQVPTFRPSVSPASSSRGRSESSAMSDAERKMLDLMREGKALTESMLTPIEKLFQAEMKLEELRKARVITDETYNRALQQARSAYEDTIPSVIKMREEQGRLNQLLAATPTAQLEKTRDDMALLAEAFTNGAITATQYFEAVQTRLGTLPDEISQVTDSMEEFARAAAESIQGAFADFLFDPFSDGLDGMLKGFGETLRRMIAEAVAADLASRIGLWGSSNSGSGGFLGGLASLAGAIFGGARAGGGDVMPNSAYLVGERGPEMFVPRTAGTVLSNAQTAGVRNEYNISVTVPQGSPQETRRAAATGAREALAFISNAGRYA